MKSAFAIILFCHKGSASFGLNAQQNLMKYWKHRSPLGKLFLHLKSPAVALLIAIAFTGVTSCCDCELPSDEELRKDIVGKWVQEECGYPYTDGNDVTSSSLLKEHMKFDENGNLTEDGTYPYCCEISCDTIVQGACSWLIENGTLTIIPAKESERTHLNRPYNIICLTENELVFDNIIISGIKRVKTCYRRE